MSAPHRRDDLVRGALAGGIAGLAMTLAWLLLRSLAGIPLVSELGADRFLPLLPVFTFLKVIGIFGGTMVSKEIAYFSSFLAQVALGVVAGATYAMATRRWRNGLPYLGAGVALVWIALVAVFFPVLESNYRGLPSAVANVTTAIGLLLGLAVFAIVLAVSFSALGATPTLRPSSPSSPNAASRRRFLFASSSLLVLAAASGGLIGRLFNRGAFVYDGTQTQAPLDPVTPTDKFYVVTKNLIDPYVDQATWRLEVSGLVEQPMTYDYQALTRLPAVTQESSMECISNGVGYHLLSNARWKGVRLSDLLQASRPKSGVVQIVLHAADGFTHTMPRAKVMEPSTLVVYEMNGEPLRQRHGAPARIVVPSSYGEMNVKWLTRISLVDHAEKGYYESQGWNPDVVHTMSRIDFPKAAPVSLSQMPTVRVTGVAFAGIRGIDAVALSGDGGQSWGPVTIDYAPSKLAWVMWHADWRPAGPGEYVLMVRATDGAGDLQTAQRQGTAPAGATGIHKVKARIVA
ncbi:MAG: molybdopterin-dependent oxidoreductase [Candidatus Dormibacteraeota bacterium]|nr:molybdopterin-dependent oxidoreductase [Candidatus Dormibacteraeota bacterium]